MYRMVIEGFGNLGSELVHYKLVCVQEGTLQKWLEPQAHLEMVMANTYMEGLVVAMLSKLKALIPCTWMLGVIHVPNMQKHPIDDLCLSV
jgi:hypothetical protein